MWWLLLPLPIYVAFIVAVSAPQAAPCVVFTGMLVFTPGALAVARRHQRRLGVEITRD
jgi:hypothetical protein